MIGNIVYEDYQKIIEILENANNNIKNIINLYTENYNLTTSSVKINRFTQELENYIKYLKNTYEINIDADKALKNIKDLNN